MTNSRAFSLRHGHFFVSPVAFVTAIVVFSVLRPGFFGIENFSSMGSQVGVLALLAVGQMFVILTRGFDISVGAVAACASTFAAIFFNEFGEIGLVAAPVAGLVFGLGNGLLIGYFGIQPIIATLGMALAVRGVSRLISDDGQAIVLTSGEALSRFTFDSLLGLPKLIWLAICVIILAALFLGKTTRGRRIYMLGSDPGAAGLVGINTASVLVGAYVLCGLYAGLAGVFLVARAGAGLPTEGAGMELQAIAAAVIGGTALSGGVGKVLPVLLGVCFVQVLLTGLNLLGVSPFAAEIVMGLVILSSGLLDRLILRVTAN
jgi:ribose/xylose/arabinose/galactoside ABC-type transport system permease subunit